MSKIDLVELNQCNVDDFLQMQSATQSNIDKMRSYWFGEHIFEVHISNVIIGYVAYGRYDDAYCMSCLMLKEEYQRKGYGSQILKKLTYTFKKKTKLLYGFVDCDNEKAINFYIKNGCKFLDMNRKYTLLSPKNAIIGYNDEKVKQYEFAVFCEDER